ncbi:hypothetical protein DFQ14_109101 [Halopolyspora algeriensis]|uniref:ScoMcrA-like SRA domain-containing protein n=2 Tax=Halopolyspora algeriensis TaxID=1500506 RepID=A0A368VL33_9ACTN|nr:hypothetical protein [Halopolyspora algeriensis]RCW41024.1 hypothetical protein DFQ14_109101 [Halopolyspora algeriensis]TQM53892.1 hypothetical protein FHU43_2067 [Halopolyspora algeriensis]
MGAHAYPWDITVGEVVRRSQVHERFGGSRQSGIAPAPKTGNILLFTGEVGKEYGYNFDESRVDGSFMYTGEGQEGDQQLTRGNKAILRDGVALRLFESAGHAQVRYLGEYQPDPVQPYSVEQAPDRNSEVRNVLVFRLWPIDQVPSVVSAEEPQVTELPVESQDAEALNSSSIAGATEAELRKAGLVRRYQSWLTQNGGELVRHEIQVPGTVRPLYTDLFDKVTGELIEAKGSAARHYMHLALGQLLDYARFVEHTSLAILVPSHPSNDLVQLLEKQGISCIYELPNGHFARASSLPD